MVLQQLDLSGNSLKCCEESFLWECHMITCILLQRFQRMAHKFFSVSKVHFLRYCNESIYTRFINIVFLLIVLLLSALKLNPS